MASLLVVSAFFSASETALFSLEAVEIEKRTQKRGVFSDALRWCVGHPRTVLVTILLSNLAANTLYFALAGFWARQQGGYGATAITIGALVALVFIAEILPKSLALVLAGPLASAVSPVLSVWARILTPIRVPLGFVLDLVSSRISTGPKIEKALSHDELEEMVKRSPERFGLGQRSATVVGELVGLSGLQVREVMVPFVDVHIFSADLKVEEAQEVVLKNRWRWLLVERAADGMPGYVDVRDLLIADGGGELGEHIRELPVIPELARLPHLLQQLQTSSSDRFLVVDEYGNDAGIVGREDVTENIALGFVRGEHEETEWPIRFRPHRGWEVPGGMGLHEFEDLFSVDLPIARNRTVGGLIVEQLDRIPQRGDKVSISGLEVEVLGVSRGRVHKVLVHFRETETASQGRGDTPTPATDDAPNGMGDATPGGST
ncbi:MAG: HlyC/CorC family transporter [Planctomycetes bacterium]|nr:HlyC/CorC family transporter [Planctomycetota bacterium]